MQEVADRVEWFLISALMGTDPGPFLHFAPDIPFPEQNALGHRTMTYEKFLISQCDWFIFYPCFYCNSDTHSLHSPIKKPYSWE